MMASLLSINVGMPKDVAWHGRTVHTGVWKAQVSGPRMVRRLNIDGDGQGDLAGHGGEQRAVLVYQLESYAYWRGFLGRDDLEYGAFGENFTVEGLSDDEVCIGDRYRIGEAEFEVTQPRVTCFRVGLRLDEPRLPSLLVAHHRPGFYMRVLTEGLVCPGDPIVRTRRGPHAMSVADVDGLLYLPGHEATRLEHAVDIPALSPGWQRSFQDMLESGSESVAAAGVPTTPPPSWAGFRPLTVVDVVSESATVTSFLLAGDDALPAFEPGQYVTVSAAGAGEPAPVRSYSLSGDPDDGRYRISVKRESRGLVSSHLHDHLRRGDTIDVAAPRGAFVLDDGTGPVLLISAGVGVTPVLSMLHRLVTRRSTREVWWVHAAHDARSHALASEAGDLLTRLASTHSHVYYTDPGESSLPDGVQQGRLTAEVVAGLGLPVDARAFVCGPESFMDDVTAALSGMGIDPAHVHTERFGSRSAINPGVVSAEARTPHAPAGPPGTGPGVTFARSGLSAPWSGSYGSVLELAEACDVPTRWSCRTGVCRTCVTAVLAGEVSYGVPPLQAPGADEVLICVARPTADLVLDL